MKLYEIDQAILDLIDLETGEILDYDAFASLQMEREQKIESMALLYKNYTAEAAALKAEKETFAKREKTAKNNADRLKAYLTAVLEGNKFETTKVKVSYRTSQSVAIDDMDSVPEAFLKISVDADKTAIKEALQAGQEIAGCHIETKRNISIR